MVAKLWCDVRRSFDSYNIQDGPKSKPQTFVHIIASYRPILKFENRSIFGKDIGKSLWLTFLGHPV